MTLEDKERFIKQLMGNLTKSLLEKTPSMPDNWDGHELRQYIVDTAQDTCLFSSGMGRSRKRAYQNDVFVHNL